MKRFLRRHLSRNHFHALRRAWRYLQDMRFKSAPQIDIAYAGFNIKVPKGHILTKVLSSQPKRNQGIRLSAKYLSEKYPDKTFVDIGANIGDTAALMASAANNMMVLVEPSDIYFDYLERNVKSFQNRTRLCKCFIGSGRMVNGVLLHREGTAQIETDFNYSQLQTYRLDVASREIIFL